MGDHHRGTSQQKQAKYAPYAQFHLQQAVQRSQQRLRDGRPRPIDALVKTLHLGDEFSIEAEEPYHMFAGMLLREMAQVREDMDEFVELDTKVGVMSVWCQRVVGSELWVVICG